MVNQIRYELTTEMAETNLGAYTLTQVDEFLNIHHQQIQLAVANMLKDCENDFDEIDNPHVDWLCEYIYKYVSMPDFE